MTPSLHPHSPSILFFFFPDKGQATLGTETLQAKTRKLRPRKHSFPGSLRGHGVLIKPTFDQHSRKAMCVCGWGGG